MSQKQIGLFTVLAVILVILNSQCSCQTQSIVLLNNFLVSWENRGLSTVFNITSPLNVVDITDAWISIGLKDTNSGMVLFYEFIYDH
jgi:hypothetical protein